MSNTNWQPIETAPKDGRLILVANIDGAKQNPSVVYYENGSLSFDITPHFRASTHEVITVSAFTHWMPLPDPPKGE